MRSLVLDASAALAYLLAEPDGPRVKRELVTRDVVLVPWLFWTEVVNALARRRRWPGSEILASVYRLEQLGLRTASPSRQMTLGVIDAVETHGISAYDAQYLVLAEMADADLMTGDAFLAGVAGARAIPITTRHRLAEAPFPYEPAERARDVDWPNWPGAAAYLEELRQEVRSELEALRSKAV